MEKQFHLVTQLNRYQNELKIRISHDSEELNKVLILTLARAIHVTGCDTLIEWCKELLSNIMNSTPLAWSSCTLKCFPPAITEYYQNFNTVTKNKAQLKQSVEEEYRKWITMSNENDNSNSAHFLTFRILNVLFMNTGIFKSFKFIDVNIRLMLRVSIMYLYWNEYFSASFLSLFYSTNTS
uniref:Mediator of RNA polymerase II transcription subunit 23 n=1 Tax=Tetranychus urticae TaxID=32264 RepID=T1KIU3_TETUR